MICNGCYEKRSEASISRLNTMKYFKGVVIKSCAKCDGYYVHRGNRKANSEAS